MSCLYVNIILASFCLCKYAVWVLNNLNARKNKPDFNAGCGVMQKNIQKSMRKIIKELSGLNNITKKMIILGLYISLLVLAAGTVLMFINRTLIGYNPYYDYISQLLVEKSFALFAEVIIGCLLVDFIFNR
jgi:hypothetical protein